MEEPAALSPLLSPARILPASGRAAVLHELRRLLPARLARNSMGSADNILPFGLAALDDYLPDGGLLRGALHEVVPASEAAYAAAIGFVVALLARSFSPPPCGEGSGVGVGRFHASVNASTSPRDPPPYPPPQGGRKVIFFVLPAYGRRRHGRLSGHGLNSLGLDPARAILVEPKHRNETLWTLAEALRSAAPQAVIGAIDRLDLKTSQKLHLAATDAGLPLFLLRPARTLEASAAATRWRIGTAEAARDRFGLYARARWHLQLERARNGRPGEWVVEYDHVAHCFGLAAALADPAFSAGAGARVHRYAGRS